MLIYNFCFYLEYFLEDCVRMLNFVPTAESRKRSRDKDEVALEDDEENMNMRVSEDYPVQTRNAMASLSEKEINFELIEVILPYVIFLIILNLLCLSFYVFQNSNLF